MEFFVLDMKIRQVLQPFTNFTFKKIRILVYLFFLLRERKVIVLEKQHYGGAEYYSEQKVKEERISNLIGILRG